MTTLQVGSIPQLTLGWRLKMALEHGGISRDAMARQIGRSPAQLSRWCADVGKPPARAFILQWADITGVDAVWLETGIVPVPSPSGGEPVKEDALAQLAARKRARHAGNGTNHRYAA